MDILDRKSTLLAIANLNSSKLLSEGTSSINIANVDVKVAPILYRIYTTSLASQIGYVNPVTSPSSFIFSLYATYGNTDIEVNSNTSVILEYSGINTSVVGDTITSGTSSGTVVYKEVYEDGGAIVVAITGDAFTTGSTLNSGGTINYIYDNRSYTKKILRNFSGPYTNETEEAPTKNLLDYEVVKLPVTAKSRKLKSRFSVEVIDDFNIMYGEGLASKVVQDELGMEIIAEIDMEIINYLKYYAGTDTPLSFVNSSGTGLMDKGRDLFTKIEKQIQKIMSDTRRSRNMFVITDSQTMAYLMSHPLFVKPEVTDNSYLIGKIGTVDIFVDNNSKDNYCLVGYRNNTTSQVGDSGLIFAPYNYSFYSATEPESGKLLVYHLARYGFTHHPQDKEYGLGKSIFFRKFAVEGLDAPNY